MGDLEGPLPLGEPSEEEKRDAIRVLEEIPGYYKVGGPHWVLRVLHTEAQRIMDDASG